MPVPHIELVARRGKDTHDGRPDYEIYAGQQRVGRIYLAVMAGAKDGWVWNINTVFLDTRLGKLGGTSADMDDALRQFRVAFDVWLGWALAQPQTHLSFFVIDRQLRAIGAR
jgi:hypothetical protein